MALGTKVSIIELKEGHPRGYTFQTTYIEEGKRKRKFFRTHAAAKAHKKKREEEAQEHGTGSSISAEERSAIDEHREALRATGLTLRGVIVDAVKAAERNSRSATIAEITDSLMQQREREKKSQRHLDDLRSRLNRFREEFGSRIAADIQTQEIDDWLVGLGVGERTVINYRRIICAMFNHGVKRRMCPDNPASEAYRPTPPDLAPGILTPAQAENLLEKSDPKILPAIALGMFAGLRSSEIEALTWGDIDFDEKTIRVKKSKSGARDVTMKPALLAWLRPYALLPAEGSVRPSGWDGRELTRKAREAAGFGAVMKSPKTYKPTVDEKGRELPPFPNNALRHSYGSYALVESQDAASVSYQLGHKGDTRILFAHYDPGEAVRGEKVLVDPTAEEKEGRKNYQDEDGMKYTRDYFERELDPEQFKAFKAVLRSLSKQLNTWPKRLVRLRDSYHHCSNSLLVKIAIRTNRSDNFGSPGDEATENIWREIQNVVVSQIRRDGVDVWAQRFREYHREFVRHRLREGGRKGGKKSRKPS